GSSLSFIDTGLRIPDHANPYFADINGDGVSDLIYCDAPGHEGEGEWEAHIWTPDGAHYDQTTPIDAFRGLPCLFMDVPHDPGESVPPDEQTVQVGTLLAIDLNRDGAEELLVSNVIASSGILDAAARSNDPSQILAVSWNGHSFSPTKPTELSIRDVVNYRI